MQIDRSGVTGNDLRQIHYFLLRTLTGVRRCMEIYRIDLDASLGDHITCHGRINTTGEKQHSLATGTYGHSSGTGQDHGVDIDFFTDLNVQHNIGMMYIHLHIGISLQDSFSHIHVDGHGILGVIFPGTSRCHLERLITIGIYFCNVVNHGLTQLLKALILYVHYRADPRNAEDSLQVRYHFIIVEFRLCIHKDTSLRLVHQEFSFTFFQCVFDLAYQSIFEQITVLSLNADLGIFYQK